jgi:two-component system, NtrC family, response regulator AtoC
MLQFPLMVEEGTTTEVGEGKDAVPPPVTSGLSLLVFDLDTSWRQVLPADGEIVVGRAESAGVRLGDRSVSRQHAKLVIEGDQAKVVDLGSANGVAVNGERVRGEARLQPRDLIMLGRATLVLVARKTPRHRVVAPDELFARARPPRPYSVVLVSFNKTPRNAAAVAERAADHADVAWISPRELVALFPGLASPRAREAAAAIVDDIDDSAPARAGCASFPVDGADLPELLARARAAVEEHDEARITHGTVRSIEIGGKNILVADPAMARLYGLLQRLAASDLPVLIQGETGVGKEAAATFVHAASSRSARPFLALNCATVPENLAESELFGYDKGAFSGATSVKPGLLESASGGTIFLDEVGELSLAVQAKLLRVVESRKMMRLGEVRERAIDIRIVAATNRDLEEEAGNGRFRQDLFFRLSTAIVRIPPLRERPGELLLLARKFLEEAAARMGRTPLRLEENAIAALLRYPWPGNVRELKNIIEFSVASAVDDVIDVSLLPPRILTEALPESIAAAPDPARGLSVQDEVRELEKRRMIEALASCDGNQSRAAALIGMPRRTFVAKLKQYRIRRGPE